METTIFKSPVCNMKNLNNLFIEMTAKNCNQRCAHCYIDFPISKKVEDFISIDTVKNALEDTKSFSPQCIYLTGAEPMTHPDFNGILRLCLKYSAVCICTNGSFINEKKARFLKKVQDEGIHEIIFKLSLAHYDEQKNDNVRCRGSFRQTLSAVKHLTKYGFNPIITVTNYYNENKNIIFDNLKRKFESIGITLEERNICINEYFNSNSKNYETEYISSDINFNTDCENGRILTTKGVYSCPFLANDHRGRCGANFNDFSDRIALETEYCNTCLKNQRQVFGINFSDFDY